MTDDEGFEADSDGDDEDDDFEDDPNQVPAPTAEAVLEYLARSVVDDPDSVEIEVEEGRRGGLQLSVRVAPDDMGRVIGRRGRVANAIRTVVRAAAARDDVRVDVEFLDD